MSAAEREIIKQVEAHVAEPAQQDTIHTDGFVDYLTTAAPLLVNDGDATTTTPGQPLNGAVTDAIAKILSPDETKFSESKPDITPDNHRTVVVDEAPEPGTARIFELNRGPLHGSTREVTVFSQPRIIRLPRRSA